MDFKNYILNKLLTHDTEILREKRLSNQWSIVLYKTHIRVRDYKNKVFFPITSIFHNAIELYQIFNSIKFLLTHIKFKKIFS